jgi:hypothetical protein
MVGNLNDDHENPHLMWNAMVYCNMTGPALRHTIPALTVSWPVSVRPFSIKPKYEGHLESKERFAIKKYLLIIGKKKNMQVLSHTFTYFST